MLSTHMWLRLQRFQTNLSIGFSYKYQKFTVIKIHIYENRIVVLLEITSKKLKQFNSQSRNFILYLIFIALIL